jgi:hypothetical protein
VSAHPAFDADRWYGAVAERRSRRAFSGVRPTDEQLDLIEATAREFRPFADARVLLVRDVPDTFFTGLVGSYGKVSGARSALVFIADATSATGGEHCGYTGEGAVLEAGALGLTTCWLAGSFSRSTVTAAVALEPGEIVRAISPVGTPLTQPSATERRLFGATKPKRRRSLDEIAPGHAEWPRWAVAGAEAARIAPSAMNRQPWRFRMEDGSAVVSSASMPTPVASPRLDCGIAMLHFELGARSEGCDGAWEPLAGRDVARWVPLS